jgi:DNA-directed RNA polymerase subunit RPC12/RpoP
MGYVFKQKLVYICPKCSHKNENDIKCTSCGFQQGKKEKSNVYKGSMSRDFL